MDGDLSDFEEKKKFLKRVHQQKRLEKLFKEVSENVCKQIRDWTEPHPVWTLLRGEYFDETKCWD